MKLLFSVVAAVAVAIIFAAWLVVWRRRATQKASEGDKNLLWVRGQSARMVDSASKRDFLRRVGLGAVASFSAWVASRGGDVRWAERVLLSSEDARRDLAGKGEAGDRPSHQDDHTDGPVHTDANHTDHHSDSNPHDDEHFDSDPHVDQDVYEGHEDYHDDFPIENPTEEGSTHHDNHCDDPLLVYHEDYNGGPHVDIHSDNQEVHHDTHVDQAGHVDHSDHQDEET